jgi:Ca2+-binding EF-hand superfamily protein
MKALTSALLVLVGLLAILCGAPAADQPKPKPTTPPTDDGQDFVFLGESRPVLVRLHIRMDGKSLQTAWDECIQYLFKYLDVNNDGVLTREEIERAPTADQFTGSVGGLAALIGGAGARPALKMEAVNSSGNGKVTLAELSTYYRKQGFTPFQFNFSSGQQNPLMALYSGGRPEPSVEAVNKAIFHLLDTSQKGKLSLKELEAATAVLLQMDENEDEIVTTRELVTNTVTNIDQMGAFMAMSGAAGRNKATSSPLLVPVLTPGEIPADLESRMLKRYPTKEQDQFTRKDVGLDEATFRQLDANGDGVLDSKELAGLVKLKPGIEIVLRLGKKKDAEPLMEVVTGDGRSPLADRFALKDTLSLFDLGMTRLELQPNPQDGPDRITAMRQDYLSQFRQADTNGDGIVDASEAKDNPRLNSRFNTLDRARAGKITEKDLNAYFDHLQELNKRVAAGSVTLTISDQSRGVFDLLDTNRDGRLSVREMRQAPKLLKQFDRDKKGYLTREDLPHTYRVELRRASFNQSDGGPLAAFTELYSTSGDGYETEQVQKGPAWFRKMDRNRDGDVSRKEWLFGDELFRKIDTDGDGLISVEEAEKADAQFRREAEKRQR